MEVVISSDTKQDVVDNTMKIMRDVGQAPVLVKKKLMGLCSIECNIQF